MLLNKQQASSLRDWYTDALQHEVKDDFTRVAVEQAEKDLLNYEIATQKQGLVPYQTNPRIERASFGRVRGIMSGEKMEPDIPERAQREAATLAYLSMRFQKPPEAVSGALPAFQKAIMDLHPGKDFEAALAEDMDSMDFRLTAIEGAYNHAARHALSGGEELDGYIQYIRPLEREIPEGLAELYMSAFESTREILEENRPAFERLAQSVEVLVQEANLNDTRALFDVVGQLASLPAEDRYLALTYLEANVEAERGPLMNFMNRVNEIARGQARLTSGQIHRNALGIIEDVRAGRPLQESVLLADKQRFDNEFAESAFRVALTAPGARTPFYRNLSPVEVAKRYEDAKKAGEFAEAMIGIEQYVNEAIGPESFAKNPSFKAAYEQIVYGGARVGADMGMILFSAGFGRKVGGRVDRMSGTGGMANVVGAAYGIQAMIPALQDEHYKMMRAEGLSVEDSYFISASSAPVAASLETMSQLFVLSKLPGISNVAGKMAFMGRRPAVSFAMSTGESVGAEVAAEVASGWTASIMQNFVALIDEDIPTANLSEKLWEQIQQAPDIALNMLPYALIGGGNSAYINRSAQQNLFSNERAMQFFGLNEAAISEVVNAEGLSAKRDAFQKHWDLDRALEMAREAKVRGVSIEDIVSRQAMEAIESAARDEGRVRVLKNEQGEITGYEIDGQDGTAAVRTLPELMELVPEPTQQQIPPVPFVRSAEPDIQTTTEDSPLADPQAQVTMEIDAIERSLTERGVIGESALNAIDLATELQENGGVINNDGTATLYHRTTPEAARAIIEDQAMIGKEDGLFFGTHPTGQIEGYGDAVVRVKIPLENIALDDVFGNEAHVKMEASRIGERVAVEAIQDTSIITEPDAVIPQQLTPKEFTEQLQQRLQSEYPGSIVRISPSIDGTALTLHRVEVPQAQRNQGVGTQIMESLIEAADIRGMQVNLTPDSSFGGSVPRLRRFYKRFGFVENKGRNKDFSTQESMIRPAREATAQPTALDDFVTRQRKRAEDAKKEIGEAWNDLQTLGIVPDQRRATQAELRMIRALANYAVSQSVAAGASVAQAMQNIIREYNLRRTPAVERAIERATRMAEQSLRAIENAQPALRESVLTQELSKITQQTEYTEPTRTVIREQTGQISPEIRMTAREAMRRLYIAQSRAATQAARFTKAELQDIKRQLAEEVVTALPLAERGKFVTAIANVTNQNQLREQIARLEKEVGRLEHRDAKRALKKTIDGLPKRMRPEYEAQVDAIVEAIDTRRMTDKTRRQLESVADFLDRNPENQIPREVLEKLKRLDLKSVDELSAQDLRELNAMLNHYVGLNELKNRLLTDRRKRSRQEVKSKMLTEIEQNRELSDETGILDRVGKMFGKDLSGLERTDRTLVQKYFGEMASRPETMFGEISEQLREMVFDGIEIDGYAREMELRHREQDKLSQRMEEAGKPFGVNATRAQNKEFTRWVNEKVPFQIAGQRINMRRNELVYLYELTQDSNRLQRLLRDGFTIERTGRKAEYIPTVEELNALPQAIGQAGVALAEGHRETYNGQLRNELNKEWVDVHFFEIAPSNDYTPSRTDPTRTAMSLEEMHTERRIMTQEGRGMFKERDANATAPLSIRDSMAVWIEHLDNTAKTVAYMKSGRDARVMLNDQEIKRAIIDRYGEDFWRFTVDKIADQTIGVQGVRTSAFDNMLRKFIQNAGISILSLRMTTPLINPSGVPIAASYMHNPANMGRALSVFGNPAQWRRIAPLMRKWSPYYRERYDNFTQQVTSGIFGERASIYNVKPVAQYGLAGIEATDKVGAYVRWRGAELDIAESRTDLEVGSDAYYREVAREWQKMMFRSENTSHGLGMSGFITAGKRVPWIAPWMIFSSSVSKIYSNARRAVVMAQRGQYKDALMVASSVMASWIVASGMRRLVRNAIRPEDEEEERSFAGDLAREGVGQLPLFGTMFSSVLMSIETGRPGFSLGTILDESLTSSGRILTNTFNAFESIATDAATREGDPQWQKDALKAIEGVAELTAMATGTPYSALSDWGKLITKVTGEKESGSDFMANLLKERGLDSDPDLTKTRSDQMNRIYRAILEEEPARFQDAVERLAQGTGERVTRAEIGRSIRGRYNKTWEVRRKIRMSDMTESQRERVQAEMNSYREDLETLNELWKMIPREATVPQ